jgi:hypothetical protein
VLNNTGNSLAIFDVSNPASPTSVGSTFTGINGPLALYVHGRYAYIVNNTGNSLAIYDVSNPASPTSVGSVTTGASSGPTAIYVQGRYAYVANNTANTLAVFDVSNPASPTSVGSVTTGASSGPNDVFVQGRYAYISNVTAGTLAIFDVSNPASPASVASASASVGELFVQGRYAYIGTTGFGAAVTAYDLGGAYIQQLELGGATAGTLNVAANTNLGGDTSIQGGLHIGQSLQVDGDVAASGSVLFHNASNSATALRVQNATNVNILTVDTSGLKLQVGSGTTDSTAVLLTLDSYNQSTDPTGVDGDMYYNTALATFRCRENGAWRDCLSHHVISLGSDVASTAATTFQDVTGLSFSMTSGTNYRFHAALQYTTSAITIGLRASVTGPASPTLLAYTTISGTNGTTGGACGSATCAWTNAQNTYDAGTTSTSSVGTTAGNILIMDGSIRPSANGTLQLRFAPETATANGIVIKAGSTLEWW